MIPQYRYSILNTLVAGVLLEPAQAAGTYIEVFPLLNNPEKKFTKEKNEAFFRETVTNEFRFNNHNGVLDYTYLMKFADDPCVEIRFKIEKYCNNAWSDYWLGYAGYYDMKINESKCYLDLTFAPIDLYTCIIENGDEKFNILETTPTVTSDSDVFAKQFEFIVGVNDIFDNPVVIPGVTVSAAPDYCMENTPVDAIGQPTYLGSLYNGTKSPSVNGYNIGDTITEGATDGWRHVQTDYTFRGLNLLTNPTWVYASKYIREIWYTKDVGGNPVIPPGSGWQDSAEVTSLGRKWWRYPFSGDDLIWSQAGCNNPCSFTGAYSTLDTITYPNGRNFKDVIQYLLDETCGDLTYQSILFEDGLNPILHSLDPAIINNPLNALQIYQKSDIRTPLASSKASRGMMSISELMTALWDMFQVVWWIEGTAFHVEHITYLKGTIAGYGSALTSDIDLTILDDGMWIEGKNIYEFSKEQIPNRETFKWMEAGFEDFIGQDIFYNNICSGKRMKEQTEAHDVLNVTTDIFFIQNNPNDVSKEGFVFLIDGSLQSTGTYAENGVLSGVFMPNAHLSWANLQDKYYRYERPQIQGILNGHAINFVTSRKIKLQKEISFKYCCEEFNPMNLIKTQMGDGEVIDATENLKTSLITVNLKF